MSPGADNQARALPGNVLLHRQRRVAECLAELLRRLLLPGVNLASIDDHVVVVGHSIDLDDAELIMCDVHRSLRPKIVQDLAVAVSAELYLHTPGRRRVQ